MLSAAIEQILQAMEHEFALSDLAGDSTQKMVFELLQRIEKSGCQRPQSLVDLWLWINTAIAEIDRKINHQLNEILHHPTLIELESAWRSLFDLVNFSVGKKNTKIRVLDVKWSEITKDVNRAVEFDQSQLFQKIYSEEFDIPGGEPYGTLIADFDIAHRPSSRHPYDDVPTLERLAEIASASFSPLLINATPQLFGLESFDRLTQPINFSDIFKQSEYTAWNRLRMHTDTRFLGVTLPRVLLRSPYALNMDSIGGLRYAEADAHASKSHYVWGKANFALAKVLIREFSEVGWFSHIRGVPRDRFAGGVVPDLTVDFFATDNNRSAHKPIADIIISDIKERELSELGFIPFCQCYDLPMGAFHSTPSLHKPKIYDKREITINEKVASSLQHVLCGSRFAHYIKVMARDKIGSYVRAEDCTTLIQNWLNEYTVSQEDAEWQMQAKYPLRKAAVSVKENPEKPGCFWVNIDLQPHYQADSLVSELHLTTELTPTQAR
jgi:type VI secretion system protein ImpD